MKGPSAAPTSERGQAAVETALITPLVVFFILGILQLTLMQQARLMLEYAAFSAARAGSVWNMDPARMRSAAVMALMPTMPTFPTGTPPPQRVDRLDRLTAAFGAALAANETAGIAAPIQVTVLNPREKDFHGDDEIDFDAADARLRTQLVVRVTYFYELRIPFANWILWETWFAGNGGLTLAGLNPADPKLFGWEGLAFDTRIDLEATRVSAPSCRFNGLSRSKLLALAAVAKTGRKFYVPLVATHTLRMQSNPFKRWAGPNDDGC